MSKQAWVGVDLGKSAFEAAVAPLDSDPEQWAKLAHAEFPNTSEGFAKFMGWLDDRGIRGTDLAGVCLEATGRLGMRFMTRAENRLCAISMVNPARPADFAKSIGLRDKTDRTAACVLALFGVKMAPEPKALPSRHQRELRELSRMRDGLKTRSTACRNQIQDGPESPVVLKRLRAESKRIECEIAAVEKDIADHIDKDGVLSKDCARIQTIPGVGAVTARTLLAEFGDLRQYSRKELVALAGLYPRQYRSGTSVHKKPRLAKGGGKRVRAALYMPALSARRHCPQLNRFAENLKANGQTNMPNLCAVMRKLLLLARALVVSGKDYDPEHVAA